MNGLALRSGLVLVAGSLFLGAIDAQAQAQKHPAGRGAMSAQDMAKMAKPLAGSDAADSVCARYAVGSAVTAPPELKSSNGVLEVTLKFETATDTQGLVRYCYVTDTGLQAPTLRVNAGDHLIIHFQNDLPAAPAAAGDMPANMAGMNMTLSPQDGATPAACNGAMTDVASNIHFHGLNVSPTCGQDEVVKTLVQPGESFDYNVLIPSNEPPGLYWYHPHPHGFSEGQVQGGATGALIVEGLQSVVPALAGLQERTFVVRDQVLPNAELNDSDIPAWDLSINFVPLTYPAYTPAVITTNPGQQELWRVANTSADTILNLQYVVGGVAQAVQVVAIDGYPIAAGTSGQNSVSQTSILMPPGSRAEFVVTTPILGAQGQLVTQYWNTGPDGDYDPTRTIATVLSQNGAEAPSVSAHAVMAHMASQAKPRKVQRFAALDKAVPVAQRNLYFSEVLSNPADAASPTDFYITEKGQDPALFTMGQPPNIVVHAGTVEDWVVENHAGEDHIFHIHQIHFQVLEANGVAINDAALRDTVDLPYWSGTGPYPSVKVRMDFRDTNITGTFVYHCHILQHEDAGMMGEIQVLPAGAASATTATASIASIAPNGAVTMTASVVDTATSAPKPTGLVQFEFNGANAGNPVALVNGVATLTTAVTGAAGAGSLTAFYQGDASYTESVSPAVPLTIAAFGLTATPATAAVGSAALASVTVNVADGYTLPVALSCALPGSLTEAVCYIDPGTMTGTGQVTLRVNSTPSHPVSSVRGQRSNVFSAGVALLASLCLIALPRRRYRGSLLLLLLPLAALVLTVGCSSGAAKVDAGTAKGTYVVVVTGTSGTGAALYQTSVNVPVTLQ